MTDPSDIPCWQRLNARITTSGRLRDGADIARLKALGVRHVVNLALADSPGILPGQDAILAAEGLRYTHIPVPFGAPDEDQFARFAQAIEADDEPVHVHCVMNWRVSAFLYRYNRDRRGMPEAEARALMERQWTPETNENADAPTWARFIAIRED